jgi:hypothetical protein
VEFISPKKLQNKCLNAKKMGISIIGVIFFVTQ